MADRDFRIDLILGSKFAQAFADLKQADARVRGLGKTVDGVNAKSSNLAGAARATAAVAVAGATAAAAVMGLYIAKTIEAEKVQAQLASRVKDTAGVAGRSLAQLNEQAGKLQNITVFDDEAIGNAQAMLLTFTQIRGINFDRTIEASADLATVMGTDIPDAAKVLGKALSDPIKGLGALNKAGVTFTADERERIKTMVEAGQVAEAQGLILDKLAGKMGTAAEAARDTLGGAIQALKNSFENLLEGDSGDEGIVGTRNAIESLITTLNDPSTKQGFDNLVAGLSKAAEAAISALAAVANFTRFVGEEVAARAGGASGDDIVRIEQSIERLKKEYTAGGGVFGDAPDPVSKLFGFKSTQGNAARFAEIKRLEAMRDAYRAGDDERARLARWGSVQGGSQSSYDAKLNPDPEGEGVAKSGKSGAKADPEAAAKKRLASLQEELFLLNAVKEGEDKASEAAQARYDVTDGEFAKASPALKAQIVAAAEAIDQANEAKEKQEEHTKAAKESEQAYKDLLATLRTPSEIAIDDAIAKLGTLNKALEFEKVTAEKLKKDAARIVDQSLEKSPEFQSPFEGINDPTGILYDTAMLAESSARLEAWRAEELEKLRAFREAQLLTEDEFNKRTTELEAEHARKRSEIKQSEREMQVQATQLIFDSMASIMRDAAGEQSKAYRVMFAISKGFAIATATLKLGEAIANASALPWPTNLPAIAAAVAQGAQVASLIASAVYTPQGYADGGYTGPGGKHQPAGIVHAGEGVLNQEEIAALGGPAGFYALRDAIDDGRMRELLYGWAGYVDGGMVTSPDNGLSPVDWASHPQGMSASSGGSVSLFNYFDIDSLRQAVLAHPDTEKAVVVYASQNSRTIKASF